MERIGAFSRKKDSPKKGYLDDITWNDLEMDQIFARVNQTLSAPGEEVLYRMLRMPLSAETSGHFQEMTEFFRKDAKAREEMQLILAGIGKKTRYSLGSAAEELAQAPEISWIAHGVQAGALVLSLFLLPVVPVAGVFAVFGFLVFNAFTYQTGKDRRDTEAFRVCSLFCVRFWKPGESWRKLPGRKRRKLPEGGRNPAGAGKVSEAFVLVHGRKRGRRGGGQAVSGLSESVFPCGSAGLSGTFERGERTQRRVRRTVGSGGRDRYTRSRVFSGAASLVLYAQVSLHRGIPNGSSGSLSPAAGTSGGQFLHSPKRCASDRIQRLRKVHVSEGCGQSNAVLAQTISVCTASFYRAPRCQICTSIALRDSIQNGESYFMAEIRSLKRILALAEEQTPVLCVIDEVLRGTNTVERIAASSGILRSLARPKVYCFAATHDLELTQILRNFYDNYHFEETVTGGDVCFSYQLKNGPSVSRNALILLERSGYGEEIVTSAREAAENFEKNGVWEVLA